MASKKTILIYLCSEEPNEDTDFDSVPTFEVGHPEDGPHPYDREEYREGLVELHENVVGEVVYPVYEDEAPEYASSDLGD